MLLVYNEFARTVLANYRNIGKDKWNHDKYQEANQRERASRNIDQEYFEKIDEVQKVPTLAERMAANAYCEVLAEYEDAEKEDEDDD
ncbi:MAG: hypothetical protein JJE53_02460 [Candidatus Pacebacteria bacterium]|nr:hypothetical protein [Candidatus Paceibacterota bacterium]